MEVKVVSVLCLLSMLGSVVAACRRSLFCLSSSPSGNIPPVRPYPEDILSCEWYYKQPMEPYVLVVVQAAVQVGCSGALPAKLPRSGAWLSVYIRAVLAFVNNNTENIQSTYLAI